jgi:pimeloyl-ACP methyl ester carboxylesterase
MPQIDNEGVKIHYEAYGEGPAMVFLHPFGANRYIWFNQIFTFARMGRVIVLDHRGHGLSDKPAQDYGIPQLASDARAVLDHADVERAVLVGNSIGSMVALQMNLDAPERAVANMLISSGTGLARGMPPEARQAFAEHFEIAYANVLEGGTSEKTKRERPEVHAYATDSFRVRGNFSQAVFLANLNHPEGLFNWNIRDRLSEIQNPTLLIAGKEDRVMPLKATQTLADHIPNARLNVLDDVGHFYQLEKPAEFNAELTAFLEEFGA